MRDHGVWTVVGPPRADGRRAAAEDRHRIIFDTDFVMPPWDDGLALILALQSPELEILGVTHGGGNESVERATSTCCDCSRSRGHPEIPVHRARTCLSCTRRATTRSACTAGGGRTSRLPHRPAGFARKQAERESAMEFIVRTVMARPGEVTIVAIGPLTNIAMALRQEPHFASG